MDYDFRSLSTYSFEQFVHSLSLTVLGPGVKPFGPGRDGGRDAVFDGTFELPGQVDPWTGYGVVQAKFLQRSSDTSTEGAWAVAELRTELDAYRKSKTRRVPAYFIFVTNAQMSAYPEAGHNDVAEALLQAFSNEYDLDGFQIWDYEQLRTFLDSNSDLRKTYEYWLNPGDLIRMIADRTGDRDLDLNRLITKALSLELCDNRFARLEQAGDASDDKIPLANVFIDLPVSTGPSTELTDEFSSLVVEELINEGTWQLDPHTRSEWTTPEQDRRGFAVVIGGPGQGKTTAVQYLCQINRAGLLRGVEQALLTPDVVSTIAEIESKLGNMNVELAQARRFPFQIDLNRFAKYLADCSTDKSSVLHYLAEKMSTRLKEALSEPDLRRWCVRGPTLFVFDGLDEVPKSSNRASVISAVNELLLDLRAEAADVMAIATTRPQGYSDEFSPKHYKHMYLRDLRATDAMAYARELTRLKFGDNNERFEVVIKRLERALDQESTARLMRSPLQVTIMAVLVDKVGQPPQQQWSLFSAYYNTIYSRELERDIPAAALLSAHRADIDAIHQHVGLALQMRSERAGGTDARLTADEFQAIVELRLRAEGHDGANLDSLCAEIVAAAGLRLVFLVGIEDERVGFEIRSLQEFMAAEALFRGADDHRHLRLSAIAPISSWRNVFVFAASRCFAEDQHLRDTVLSICNELNTQSLSSWSSDYVRAGSLLALDLLQEGSCRSQPKYLVLLFKIVCELIPTPDLAVHQRIAAVYIDLDLASYLEGADKITIKIANMLENDGDVVALGAFATLLEFAELGSEAARQQLIARSSTRIEVEVAHVLERASPWAMTALVPLYLTRCNPGVLRNTAVYLRSDWGDVYQWPEWVSPALRMATFSYTRAVTKFDPKYSIETVFALKLLSDRDLLPLAELPQDAHAAWAVFRSIGILARDMSNEAFLDVCNSLDSELSGLALNLPWIFANWTSGASGEVLRDRATQLGLGAFLSVESRWRESGLLLEDITHDADYIFASIDGPWLSDRLLAYGGYSDAGPSGSADAATLAISKSTPAGAVPLLSFLATQAHRPYTTDEDQGYLTPDMAQALLRSVDLDWNFYMELPTLAALSLVIDVAAFEIFLEKVDPDFIIPVRIDSARSIAPLLDVLTKVSNPANC